MSAARTIADFEGYLKELSEPGVSKERAKFILGQSIACDDLINYSAEVCDLNSPVMVQLDRTLTAVFAALRALATPNAIPNHVLGDEK